MVSELNNLCIYNEQVLLDMTNVRSVQGNVIPNLLLLGKWLEEKTGFIPIIRLGRTFDAGYLKKFLYNIKFYTYSKNIFLYEDEIDMYCGLQGEDMTNLNTTCYYSFPYTEYNSLKEVEKQSYRKKLGDKVNYYAVNDSNLFLRKYFSYFNYGSDLDGYNILSDIVGQIISNCFARGSSEAYMTMQAKYKDKKVFFSISDRGCGMLNSMIFNRSKLNEDTKGFFLLDKEPNTEEEAIIESIFYRKDSAIYGLNHVIYEIIKHMNGIVRIHSNDTQLILTRKAVKSFDEFNLLSYFDDYNKRYTALFPGTHIEIEIPMEVMG